MILGLSSHPAAACFAEINDAVIALRGRDDVCFNAHRYDAPPGTIVYNFENVPGQVDPARWAGREVWDFSARNAAQYGAKHVPVGYHPSMERFNPSLMTDAGIVFAGCMNERRRHVLQGLADLGHVVTYIPPGIYGKQRDDVLARATLVLSMLFYPDGVFPALRVAHLVANNIPVLSEHAPEEWDFVPRCSYENMIQHADRIAREDNWRRGRRVADARNGFKAHPMVLP